VKRAIGSLLSYQTSHYYQLVEMSQKSYIRDEPVVVDREAGVERD